MLDSFQKRIFIIMALAVGLVMVGSGCISSEDETADTVVTGAVKTPLAALDKAKQLTGTEQARLNRQAEESSNYVTVALILTEGSDIPEGVVLGPTIGCSDRVAMVSMSRVSDSGEVVIDALNTLFGLRDPSPKDFYSSLAFSDVKVLNRSIATSDGVNVMIRLEGDLVSSGVCDTPRIKAQVEETIRHFYPNFKIVLNGSESAWRCFGDQSELCK